ncbi:hypothetical protein ACWCOV_21210 [Kribbella sp. NPDC002412]
MRIKRVMAALLVAPLVGLLPGGTPAAQASPDPYLKISDVTLGKTAVAVSGLNLAPVQVTVEGGYSSGHPDDENIVLNVVLERTGGTGPLESIFSTDLKRTAGTVEDGVWTGTLNAASTANGTFKVTGVMTGPFGAPIGGTPVDPTPFDGPSLTVTGTHLPKVTASVSPRVVPFGSPYSIRWAITDIATGKPYGSRIRALLGVDVACAESTGGEAVWVRTDTNGIVTKSYRAADADALNCLQLTGQPYNIGGQWLFVARWSRSTARSPVRRTSARSCCSGCTARVRGAGSVRARCGRAVASR